MDTAARRGDGRRVGARRCRRLRPLLTALWPIERPCDGSGDFAGADSLSAHGRVAETAFPPDHAIISDPCTSSIGPGWIDDHNLGAQLAEIFTAARFRQMDTQPASAQ